MRLFCDPMDSNTIQSWISSIDGASTDEELEKTFLKVFEDVFMVQVAVEAIAEEDGPATSYKDVKKALWNKKLMETPSSKLDRKREVKLNIVVPRLAKIARRAKGEVNLPHEVLPKVTEGALIDLYGLPSKLLQIVFDKVKEVAQVVSPTMNLAKLNHIIYTTLFWMRKNATVEDLQREFGLAKGSAYRAICKGIIYLRVATDHLVPKSGQWKSGEWRKKKDEKSETQPKETKDGTCKNGRKKVPTKLQLVNYYGNVVEAIGNLDGTAMYRRIKHNQACLLFRGDRDRAALTTQILSDWNGMVLEATVAYGHNSDGSILAFSGLREKLEALGLGVLVDSGYEADSLFITPESGVRKSAMSSDYNTAHSSVRSGVEQVNSWIKNWKVVTACRASIKLHSTAIIVACCLYNLWRTEFPLDMTIWNNGTDLSALTEVGPQTFRGVDREAGNALKEKIDAITDMFSKMKSSFEAEEDEEGEWKL